jgi:epoxyqueuosine reductase
MAGMDSQVQTLFDPLIEEGYQIRAVSIERLQSLQTEIEERVQRCELDDDFYRTRLAWFRFHPPKSLSKVRSLIVAALPRPQTQASFTWHGQRRTLSLPPTYTDYDRVTQHVADALAAILKKKGHKVAKTGLPLKLLATRSGLAEYGRNNICYVPGMGSFLQLVAVYSDMPCQEDTWQEPTMMKACDSCQKCRIACPTEAIPSDRFLLRAERCIVFHNEKPGEVPFPTWMNPAWHNCVVGCFRCQKVCPLNREFLRWIGGHEEFSEQETSMLLDRTLIERLPEETLGKLKRLSLDGYLEALPRNLGVFFGNTA